ncbi:hypothetical protein ACFVTX_18160 [Agromyces sp. NPDC058136]|uniref:hypothetical protein n=1 Tax=Agromyces sp. NPDC058136 TaxID=3346354 RepID=UPI0036D76B34
MARSRVRATDTLTTVLEFAGAAAIAYGVALMFLPAGIIVGGAALIGLSYLIQRGAKR